MPTSRRQFLKTSPITLALACSGPMLVSSVPNPSELHDIPSGQTAALLDPLNVVWDSASKDSFGSMPLGNGDVGANVWVEPDGDVLFYISKVDAYDAGHLLPKLGRVRLRFSPSLDTGRFTQTLVLKDGAIEIQAGGVQLRIWIDAHRPVLRVSGSSASPVTLTASFETLRSCIELDDSANRLAWAYRNENSAWMEHVRKQNSAEFAAHVQDPILHRTSGCLAAGPGFVRSGKRSLALSSCHSFELDVCVLSEQTDTVAKWFALLERPVTADWIAHRQWWRAFWDRSWIRVTGCGSAPVELDQCRYTQYAQGSIAYTGHKQIVARDNAFQITQRYALERLCEAAAGRGSVPPPYNGSIFTMDMPAGVQGFKGPQGAAVTADQRDWAVLSFMWQNTRHPYWSMATRGDYDSLLAGMSFVRDGLEVCRDRCANLFHHDGAYIMEASWWKNVGVFNPDNLPRHLRYHFLATLEVTALMCEYYEHTRDPRFRDEILRPCAEQFLRFYELHYPERDADGKMVIAPAGTVETYANVTNPNTEVVALRFVLSRLISFDFGPQHRTAWSELLARVPAVPFRTIRGLTLLATGQRYEPGRELCESPELYSIYPFRQAWLGHPELLNAARQSFHVRGISIDGSCDEQVVETGGWQSTPVQAAYLGLPREAARLASINFNDQFITWHDNVDPAAPWPNRPRSRFPAFWECKMDGTPDNDHGANSVNALQSMLLQSDGEKILLLPAWPENWDVEFKLHASRNTTVECVYRNGRVQSLHVTPTSRRTSVIDRSTQENRIRNLVSVALCDYNYLFDLPPMLDGLPTPGPATKEWISAFGFSLQGVKAGPWKQSVFRGNIAFIHLLDWNGGTVILPPIPARLLGARAIVGVAHVTASKEGLKIDGKPGPLDTIVELTFDTELEPIAWALPSEGSLTLTNKFSTTRDMATGLILAQVSFDSPQSFCRFELTIDNPRHRRGQWCDFQIQLSDTGESWRTVYEGKIYGSICGKQIAPQTAKHVRAAVYASGIRQFDLFDMQSSHTNV